CKAAGCGDGYLQEGVEACDDGNLVNEDACTEVCQLATCGDGIIQAGVEECDDKNEVNADMCSLQCHDTPVALTLTAGGETATYGGDGGDPFDDSCPQGQALIGFSGKLDGNNWHGNVAGICGTLALDVEGDAFVIAVSEAASLPLRGAANQNGQGWSRYCPAGEVVVGFSGRNGWYIDQLTFYCAAPQIAEDGDGFFVSLGAAAPLAAIGGPGGDPFPETYCPMGQIATRQRGRASNDLDRFGLGCANINLLY
ncbi:MAG: DUF4215 domain-containing protein, partial [Myxococcales bacterium]|nr:DUF4215 domain-containing protein [Myxococcales bacterium]